MEVLYESGKASGGREESYLLSRSYELQANESHEARFTFSLGPITVSTFNAHLCLLHVRECTPVFRHACMQYINNFLYD